MVDHLAVIANESKRFIEILRQGPLDAPVPGTPGWTLSDLGSHMADVQQWATSVITTGSGAPSDNDAKFDEAATALETTYPALIEALENSNPEDPCWNFSSTAPQTKAFWYRRQANEVSIHRWDAESAISTTPPALDQQVAVDAIDEFVRVSLQRVIEREDIDVSTLDSDVHLHCTDTEGEWTFEIEDGDVLVVDEHRKAAAAIRGTASDLALFMYGRIGTDGDLEVFGEPAVLHAWSPIFAF